MSLQHRAIYIALWFAVAFPGLQDATLYLVQRGNSLQLVIGRKGLLMVTRLTDNDGKELTQHTYVPFEPVGTKHAYHIHVHCNSIAQQKQVTSPTYQV